MLSFCLVNVPCVLSIDTQRHFQAALLDRVFAFINEDVFLEVSQGLPFDEICQWPKIGNRFNVQCYAETGNLSAFSMTDFDGKTNDWIGDMDIGFFPNSTVDLEIRDCAQMQEIFTRTLPKNSEVISLMDNKYFGVPDLSTLPKDLETLLLKNNWLTGPINLCFLPSKMVYLNVQENNIAQEVVLYGNIPEVTRGIFITSEKIGGLYAISGGSKVDKGIFTGMKKSKIH